MKIIDLKEKHLQSYFTCLERWSEEMQEAKDHKSCWYQKFRHKGLGVKLAQNDAGVVAGMIQYLPIEESFVNGRDLYFILCIWVQGHTQGIGGSPDKPRFQIPDCRKKLPATVL